MRFIELRKPERARCPVNKGAFYFILSISWSISSFCSAVRKRHFENNSCWYFWKFHFRSFWEELCKAYSEWVADDLQCADTRKRIAVEHIWNGGYGKPRLFRKTVFAPSMALHQFCYALFYVHQIHLLIILYVSTEKKIVAKSIADMSQVRYIDNTKPKEGILWYHIVRRNCVLGRWCSISVGQTAFEETGPLDSSRPYSSRKAHYT